VRQAQDGFVPLISKAPGFVRYGIVDAGNDTLVSISTFEDRAGAETSTKMAADFIKQHLASLVTKPPEVTAGELVVRASK
jgi:hypothetical protein